MIIFMSLGYLCLRICNVDDAKVIVIDRICTCSKLIFQPESNKQRTKTGNQKHTAQRRKIKTNRVVQRQRYKTPIIYFFIYLQFRDVLYIVGVFRFNQSIVGLLNMIIIFY